MLFKLNISVCFLYLLAFLYACGNSPAQHQQDGSIAQSIADSCDNPDAPVSCCFIGMPKNISAVMTIATPAEPGERLRISGTIYKADGVTPYPDVILYAYQTDNTGRYTKQGNETGIQKWHGHLHGWCKTDSNGYYGMQTIRPARYPDNSMPAHIHAAVKTFSGQMFYISDFVFKDDSLVNKKYLASLMENTGGTGIVDVQKTKENGWTGMRNITITRSN